MMFSSHSGEFVHDVHIGGTFDVYISHRRTPFSTTPMHSHDFCEFVMYTEGRKSVYVNESIYISDIGCVFTFRPGERHSGVHREGELHERYMAQFPVGIFDGIPGGRELLSCFFDREAGKNNMIILPGDVTYEGFSLLDEIIMLGEGENPAREALILANLIRFLSLLCRYYQSDNAATSDLMPAPLREIISFIDANLRQLLRVADLCDRFGLSVSSLERLFHSTLGVTPRRFIFVRRIELAKILLNGGATVTEACYGAGFGDYSHFISDFRKEVGVTPAKFCEHGGDAQTML